MDERRCPDCGVRMEERPVRTSGGHSLAVDAGRRDGVLGKLGVNDTVDLEGVRCPECGLVRLYADGE